MGNVKLYKSIRYRISRLRIPPALLAALVTRLCSRKAIEVNPSSEIVATFKYEPEP